MTPDVVRDDVAEIVAADLPWQQFSGQRVVVTGAGGFLGNYLVRTLLALYPAGRVNAPVHVVAMVRDRSRGEARFADFNDAGARRDLEFLEWDLNSLAVPDLGAVDVVLHAASQASPRFYDRDPVGTLLPNTLGTIALLAALQAAPAPKAFFFISSGDVYGQVGERELVAEDDYGPLDPSRVRACYSESKRMAETIAVSWQRQYGTPVFIGRLGHTYGPGLGPEDGRVFADFAYNVARNEHIRMMSDGSARRPFCYITDAVVGVFTVLLRGGASVPYNISNPAGELSVGELAELLVSLFPEKGLRVERHAPSDPAYVPSPFSRTILDDTRLRSLGWIPRVTPTQGFRRFISTIS